MTSMVISHTNGFTAPDQTHWLRQSVQQFFSNFNWEDNPPEIQELRQVSTQTGQQTLSLTLSVTQFFNAVNWEGSSIAAMPHPETLPSPSATNAAFTLEDFSDLF